MESCEVVEDIMGLMSGDERTLKKYSLVESMEGCGSCESFGCEGVFGIGWCFANETSTTCDDYCGDWKEKKEEGKQI